MEGEVEWWLGVCENDRGVDAVEAELKRSVVMTLGERKHRVWGGIGISSLLISSGSVNLSVH